MRGIPRQAVHRDTPILGTDFTARDAAHHFSVCAWNTDMYGMRDNAAAQAYYDSICRLYADWGVDFIKCDDICVTEFRKWDDPYNARHEIEMLHRSLQNCGREMVLSLSPGPADIANLPHLRRHAQMWRMTGDFGTVGTSCMICLTGARPGRACPAPAAGRIAICCRWAACARTLPTMVRRIV